MGLFLEQLASVIKFSQSVQVAMMACFSKSFKNDQPDLSYHLRTDRYDVREAMACHYLDGSRI